ncbi:glycosyltransferase family 2 protein [Lactobacillus helveticus]|uniref:glycosyltransferase family 2 protein n=1 Tax=Lactobacillus helveticus TaxID=1587 RepID=UPI001561F312|nr:glycosyltransferase family 2 protein [Lactobacillus helveticus]NRO89212.1 hypothetical protein [Lactobacillus helveticus]
MKIISFTMVNNESEIIESFIRYNSNFVDKMVIIDNGCTDNTMEIVHLLQNEGYKIDTYDESLQPYDQFRLDNKYLNIITNKDKPDILIPLDADEFLTGKDNPRKVIESLTLDQIYYVHWKWYVLTGKENKDEQFIPKRITYRLSKDAWNSVDGTPVTKVFFPTKYFKKNKLTLTMGHHDVFGSEKINKKQLVNISLAHFRAISSMQIISKTESYVMRDIATMSNNNETAQRTNQFVEIRENENNLQKATTEVSYGGYKCSIENHPLNLSFCDDETSHIKYAKLSNESLADRVLGTGISMAIRSYNLARKPKEKSFLAPIVVWMDGIKKADLIFPDPSNHITLMASKYNIRAYLTDEEKIAYLKANYRLIINPKNLKFIPHKYVVIPVTVNFDKIKEHLVEIGISSETIISEKEYLKRIGIVGRAYTNLCFVPSIIKRINLYIKRNGMTHTFNKIKERIKK